MALLQGKLETLNSSRTVTPANSSTLMHTMNIAVAWLTELKFQMMLDSLTEISVWTVSRREHKNYSSMISTIFVLLKKYFLLVFTKNKTHNSNQVF